MYNLVDVSGISFCTVFVWFCTFIALEHYFPEIFIRLDMYAVLHGIPWYVNIRFYQQKSFCVILSLTALCGQNRIFEQHIR